MKPLLSIFERKNISLHRLSILHRQHERVTSAYSVDNKITDGSNGENKPVTIKIDDTQLPLAYLQNQGRAESFELT